MTIPIGLLQQARNFKRALIRRCVGKEPSAVSRAMRHGAHRSLSCGEEGGALVEIALTVPVLLGVLTGIITFGLAYSNQITLTQAVGSAGQYLAQIRTSTSDPCADTWTALKSAAPGLVAANITMTVTMNGTAKTATTCSGSQTLLVQGSPVTVYATYPCGLSVYGVSFAGSCKLAAKVTEYEY